MDKLKYTNFWDGCRFWSILMIILEQSKRKIDFFFELRILYVNLKIILNRFEVSGFGCSYEFINQNFFIGIEEYIIYYSALHITTHIMLHISFSERGDQHSFFISFFCNLSTFFYCFLTPLILFERSESKIDRFAAFCPH